MTPEELDAIEARTRHRRIDVPMPRCTHDEERGHAPWCHDCDRERQERIGSTFETHGRGDVVALVAEVRRLTTERDAAFTRGVEAMREAAAKVAAQCASERGHTQATMFAASRPDDAFVVGIKGGEASRIEELIRALKVAP